MSGTSMDAADAALVDLTHAQPKVLAFASESISDSLRAELLALNTAGDNEIERAAIAANALTALYVKATQAVLASAGIDAGAVRAIGCHGQTVRHRPDLGFTTQIANPSLLAELTGIDVVADFRSRDIAAGGVGAPLAPVVHSALFRHSYERRVVVNIGGIANCTILLPTQPTLGFDTGPGNVLMDVWCHRHTGKPYDADGAWAATGRMLPQLLERLLAEPYFSAPPPKSTGRDLFSLVWLQSQLAGNETPQDVQRTLLELTAISIAHAVLPYEPEIVYFCGGGVHNTRLRAALARQLGVKMSDTGAIGVPPQQVEAVAFAWLAKACIERQAVDTSPFTGAAKPVVLGAVYPK